jgi:hypothetical protein
VTRSCLPATLPTVGPILEVTWKMDHRLSMDSRDQAETTAESKFPAPMLNSSQSNENNLFPVNLNSSAPFEYEHEYTEADEISIVQRAIDAARSVITELEKLDERVSRGLSKRVQYSIDRADLLDQRANSIIGGPSNRHAAELDTLRDLAQLSVDFLARRLGLDQLKLMGRDPAEWKRALNGELGAKFSKLKPNLAAFASSLKMPQAKKEPPNPALEFAPKVTPLGRPLPKRCESAYQESLAAIAALGNVVDRDLYGWVQENYPEGKDIQDFTTWIRYVREGRKFHGTNKNSGRTGRTGRSIITSDEIDRPRRFEAD